VEQRSLAWAAGALLLDLDSSVAFCCCFICKVAARASSGLRTPCLKLQGPTWVLCDRNKQTHNRGVKKRGNP